MFRFDWHGMSWNHQARSPRPSVWPLRTGRNAAENTRAGGAENMPAASRVASGGVVYAFSRTPEFL